MKIFTENKVGLVLVTLLAAGAVAGISSCKKDSANASNSGLLVGSASKAWQIDSLSATGSGAFKICSCAKKNNRIAFYADGTFAESSYICNATVDSSDFSNDYGASGQWSLAPDNIKLTISGTVYNVVSVTSSSLVLDRLYNGMPIERLFYISANSQPFLSRTQQLCSTTGSKTWKYLKRTLNDVVQPLTPAQAAATFTFSDSGVLTNSFTNTIYGQALNSTWVLYYNQSYINVTSTGVLYPPAATQSYYLLELTPASLVLFYYDNTQKGYISIYLTPQ